MPENDRSQLAAGQWAERLELLQEQYKAAFRQLNSTLSEVDAVRLRRQIDDLEAEMSAVEARLTAAGGSTADSRRAEGADGLFLQRLINPQQRGAADITTTVWISANGPLQYVIDSVRIRDNLAGPAGPTAVVAMPPDAEYRFTFAEGSDRVHALNPALSVGPETRRTASFTIGTSAETPCYQIGSLAIWVRYHASDGRMGTLILSEPAATLTRLAALVGEDVRVRYALDEGGEQAELTVTPAGLQRGLEPHHPPRLTYTPIFSPSYEFSVTRAWILNSRAELGQRVEISAGLRQVLADEGRLAALARWLEENDDDDRTAPDLLGGVATPAATAMLTDALKRAPLRKAALHGLLVRHLVVGDGLLADLLAENRGAAAGGEWRVAQAAALVPGPRRLDLLSLLRERESHLFRSYLGALWPELETDERDALYGLPQGPLDGELYVRGTMNGWITPPPAKAKFTYGGGGLYTADLTLEAKVYEFKVAPDRWWEVNNFGAADPGPPIRLGEPFPLFAHHLSRNIVLDLTTQQAGRYRFTLDASDPGRPTVSVRPPPAD